MEETYRTCVAGDRIASGVSCHLEPDMRAVHTTCPLIPPTITEKIFHNIRKKNRHRISFSLSGVLDQYWASLNLGFCIKKLVFPSLLRLCNSLG